MRLRPSLTLRTVSIASACSNAAPRGRPRSSETGPFSPHPTCKLQTASLSSGRLAFGALGPRERVQPSDCGIAPGAGAPLVAVQPLKVGDQAGQREGKLRQVDV